MTLTLILLLLGVGSSAIAAEAKTSKNPSVTQTTRALKTVKAGSIKSVRAIRWTERLEWKACPEPRWLLPTAAQLKTLKQLPGGGQRIVVIGDSLTKAKRTTLIQKLLDRGWVPTVVCWGGKSTAWGLQQLKKLKKVNRLPATVVVALGTNDMFVDKVNSKTFKARTKALTKFLIPRVQQLQFVNIFVDIPRLPARWKARFKVQGTFNKILNSYVNSKTSVINVASPVSKQPRKYISSDGVHYSKYGENWRINKIVQSLKTPAKK